MHLRLEPHRSENPVHCETFNFFISICVGSLFYLVGWALLPFTVMCTLSKMWPVGAPAGWPLWPSDMPPSFFERFLVFRRRCFRPASALAAQNHPSLQRALVLSGGAWAD